jgi:uncharacterized protein
MTQANIVETFGSATPPIGILEKQSDASSNSGFQSKSAAAPAWHTLIVLMSMLGFSLLGAHGLPGINAHGRIGGYIRIILLEWLTVGFIWWGLNRRVVQISELVGGRWASAREFFRDFAIGIGFILICGFAMVNGIGYLLKAAPNASLLNMLPRSGGEIFVYLLLSMTAGFCEELIFRGYLRRQFSALTGSAVAGIVLQGIVFGAAHGYQGWKFMLIIAVYGTMFGFLARWRRSLRPGMLAHGLQDGAVGIIMGFLMH